MTNPMEPTPQAPIPPHNLTPVPSTFQAVAQPRSANRLQLDGTWHQISKNYIWVQLISNGIVLVLIIAAVLVGSRVADNNWILLAALAAVPTLWLMLILPRQARSIGFQLREDDIVFRRGILWQRMVAVPYGRLQLVDITHGPLDRAFGIAQLKLVTAAATTAVSIPGLPQATAEELRDELIAVAESRRAGL